MELNLSLHEHQLEVFRSPARFKVLSAGRRFGKTRYACVEAISKVLEHHPPHVEVWYVAPTFQLAKEVAWPYLTSLGKPIWKNIVAHEGSLQAINGRWLRCKGADRPEVLLGRALSHVVIDEYATMKPHVWEHVLRPMLSDVKGTMTAIGTSDGKNHFYELLLDAQTSDDMEAWQFKSVDNPFLDPDEIQAAKKSLSRFAFKRQYESSFTDGSGTEFKDEHLVVTDQYKPGDVYIAVDPAGYSDSPSSRQVKYSRLDETAIAVVEVSESGWHVHDIAHGRWGIRETSIKILRMAQQYRPRKVAIEKGALHAAIIPYLHDQMRRLNIYPFLEAVSHGNQKKYDRIIWALQGRFEHGRITLAPGEYVEKLREQMLDFPSRQTHDDLLDALSYIAQVAVVNYHGNANTDTWQPIDAAVGY